MYHETQENDKFVDCEKRRRASDRLFTAKVVRTASLSDAGASAIFFAWYAHQGYCEGGQTHESLCQCPFLSRLHPQRSETAVRGTKTRRKTGRGQSALRFFLVEGRYEVLKLSRSNK